MERYRAWMAEALELASAAGAAGEVPVGALIISPGGEVIARAGNSRPSGMHAGEGSGAHALSASAPDPTAHAEILAIRRAAAVLNAARLDGCTLVVTLEPCVMCAGAVLQARLSRIVFGAWDEKAGAVGGRLDVIRESGLPHSVEVVAGVSAEASAALLQDFFEPRR